METTNEELLVKAIAKMKVAREDLAEAGKKRSASSLRRAIESAEDALEHVERVIARIAA